MTDRRLSGGGGGGGDVFSCDVSLTPKNIDFCSSLFAVCLSLACLRWTRRDSKIGPSSWTRSWICHLGRSKSRIGLPSPKRNQFFSLGGGLGFWILTFLGRVPKKRPKKVSGEKIDLQVFPHFSSNQCPMNRSASCILMVLNLPQGKTSWNPLVSQ